ncbi:flagellar basal body-associated FliL family protein [bacterium]|nr:flagellar basal body-associated FliL family protein [bacterium]
MAQKEEGTNPIIKYLIFAIVGILTLILIISVSLFVFDSLLKFQTGTKQEDAEKTDKSKTLEKSDIEMEVANYPMKDELTLSADDGIVILKVDLGLNDTKLLDILVQYEPLIKDTINRAFIDKTVDEIKKSYSTKQLNSDVLKKVQKRLDEAGVMNVEKGWFSSEKKLKILNIYFVKFLVTKEG